MSPICCVPRGVQARSTLSSMIPTPFPARSALSRAHRHSKAATATTLELVEACLHRPALIFLTSLLSVIHPCKTRLLRDRSGSIPGNAPNAPTTTPTTSSSQRTSPGASSATATTERYCLVYDVVAFLFALSSLPSCNRAPETLF